jgi:hypothetical protein
LRSEDEERVVLVLALLVVAVAPLRLVAALRVVARVRLNEHRAAAPSHARALRVALRPGVHGREVVEDLVRHHDEHSERADLLADGELAHQRVRHSGALPLALLRRRVGAPRLEEEHREHCGEARPGLRAVRRPRALARAAVARRRRD